MRRIPIGLAGWVIYIGIAAIVGSICAAVIYADVLQKREFRDGNRDPRAGKVLMNVTGTRWKQCDGTTLLYYAEGRRERSVSAVPNSAECAS